ncbi:MAG: outer membrane protein assembly factor BamE [Planctomycetes bacterium]|nr:outer membrane protein assembly factor BamE [Planctomycetota bacterium]
MRSPTLFLSLLALAIASSGCAFFRANRNEPLDPERIAQLRPGMTTARQAVELLGAPTQVVQLGTRSAYRYDHSLTKGTAIVLVVFIVGNADTRGDRLWLFFDENDVLTHVGASLEAHRAQYAMPWSDIHEESDVREADAERPGLEALRDGAGGQ